tara:strand:+ start:2082 stop:2423 length:342 start_codon:yes stop_codon:yes gene_type:complete
MATSPGTYNITLQRRADFSVLLQFKDSTNQEINIAGYTVYAQVWNTARSKKYADFAVAYTSMALGKVTLSLTDLQTAEFPDNLVYDVLLEDNNGIREYYLEGTITVSQGYTSP